MVALVHSVVHGWHAVFVEIVHAVCSYSPVPHWVHAEHSVLAVVVQAAVWYSGVTGSAGSHTAHVYAFPSPAVAREGVSFRVLCFCGLCVYVCMCFSVSHPHSILLLAVSSLRCIARARRRSSRC